MATKKKLFKKKNFTKNITKKQKTRGGRILDEYLNRAENSYIKTNIYGSALNPSRRDLMHVDIETFQDENIDSQFRNVDEMLKRIDLFSKGNREKIKPRYKKTIKIKRNPVKKTV